MYAFNTFATLIVFPSHCFKTTDINSQSNTTNFNFIDTEIFSDNPVRKFFKRIDYVQ